MMGGALMSFLQFFCKHEKHLVGLALVVFSLGLLFMQHTNKINLERQSAVIHSLHEKVITRDKIIDEMRDDLDVQRRVSEERLHKEQEIREQSYEQIKSIKTMLENHQCGRARLPTAVVDGLRK